MMAQNPVVAKEGGMTHYADCKGLTMRLSSNLCRLFLGWVVVSKRLDPGSCGSRRFTRIDVMLGSGFGSCFSAGRLSLSCSINLC